MNRFRVCCRERSGTPPGPARLARSVARRRARMAAATVTERPFRRGTQHQRDGQARRQRGGPPATPRHPADPRSSRPIILRERDVAVLRPPFPHSARAVQNLLMRRRRPGRRPARAGLGGFWAVCPGGLRGPPASRLRSLGQLRALLRHSGSALRAVSFSHRCGLILGACGRLSGAPRSKPAVATRAPARDLTRGSDASVDAGVGDGKLARRAAPPTPGGLAGWGLAL
jgi:hypothetical protein